MNVYLTLYHSYAYIISFLCIILYMRSDIYIWDHIILYIRSEESHFAKNWYKRFQGFKFI